MNRRAITWIVAVSCAAAGSLLGGARDAWSDAPKTSPQPTVSTRPIIPRVPTARGSYVWTLNPDDCSPGVRHQPGGPFGAIVFCEQSLGAYVALAYLEPMGAPRRAVGAWSVGSRVWQDSTWAADVTSFAWAPDGQSFIVATGNSYGSGGLFQLELATRKVKQLAPATRAATMRAPGPGYVVERLNLDTGVLHFRAIPWNLPPGEAAEDSLSLPLAR